MVMLPFLAATAVAARSGDASGRVVDASGMPAAGVVVTAANGAGSSVTNPDGRFAIKGAAGATLTLTRDGATVATVMSAGADVVVKLAAGLRTIGRAAVAVASTTDAGQVTTTDDTSLLGRRSIYATPYSVGGYTNKLIESAQARSLSDIVTNDPGLRVASSAYGDTELLSIRGFDFSSGAALFDGLSGLVNFTRPPLEGVERVDIIKGPSALLNNDTGVSAVGGSINFIPKRAGDVPNASLEFSGLPLSDEEAHLDVGQRFGPSNDFGVRVNVAGRNGATPIDNQHENFSDETLGFDYRRRGTQASIDYVHEQHTILGNQPSVAVPEGVGIPVAPNNATNVFDRSSTFETSSTMVALQLQQRISPNVSAVAAYGHRLLQDEYEGAAYLSLANANGDAMAFPFPYYLQENDDSARIVLRARADTGPLRQEFALSIDDGTHPYKNSYTFGNPVATNIYHPIPLAPLIPDVPPNENPPEVAGSREHSIALADVVTVGRLTVIGGARHQYIDQQSFDSTTGGQTSDAPSSKYTPSIAGLYKVGAHISIYANYIEQLQDGAIAPSTAANAGKLFPAFAARQTEAGAKADYGRFGATIAAYSIFEPIAITDPTTNVFSQSGEQRNKGVELSLFGSVTPHVRVIAGLSTIQGLQVATAGGATNGLSAVGVPNFQSNVNVDADIPAVPGLGVNGRVITASHQSYDLADTQSIPSWATFELGASYAAHQKDSIVTTRFAIENATNLNYWQSTRDSALSFGVPRTYRLSVTFAKK